MRYDELYIYLVDGVVEDEDRNFGPYFIGNWVEDQWSFLFFSRPSRDILNRELTKEGVRVLDEFFFTYDQWQGEELQPLQIGNIKIVPPWGKNHFSEKEKTIFIDPGVVFGSGLHPTTQHCLIFLQDLYKRYFLEEVLDLGTGTGILAIASACLGAKKVIAVDVNPLCVKTASKNVKLNGMESQIEVKKGFAEDFTEEKVDLVLANVHYEVMEKLFREENFRERPWYILSGLMRSESIYIKDMLAEHNIKLIRELDHEMTWFTLLATNVNNWNRC